MRFEHIVLLIIAFNVVSAVLQRRARKARAKVEDKALRDSGGAPADPEEAWYEDEEEEERGARPVSRAPGSDASVPERPARQPSFAQDILDQIKRDLGLKPEPTPSPSSRAPRRAEIPATAPRPPEPRAVREDENERRERLERRERELEAESIRAREQIREWERIASVRTRHSGEVRGEPKPSPAASRRPSPPVVAASSGASGGRMPDLRDPKRLREAFVAKEILDAPLARRPRR